MNHNRIVQLDNYNKHEKRKTAMSITQTTTTKLMQIGSKVLLFWRKLYQAVPRVYIPSTKLDVSFTLVSFLFFLFIRGFAEVYFQMIRGWDQTSSYRRYAVSTSVVSISHSVLLVPSLGVVLSTQPYIIAAKIQDYPKLWQDATEALLQLCTGYMLYDITGMMMSNDWRIHSDDVPYLLHHLATATYMTLVRIIGAGQISAMTLMFTGEMTNPLQSMHTISKFSVQFERTGSFFHIIHPYVEFFYAILYSFIRLIVGPLQIIHITYALWFTKLGRQNIPLYISSLWIVIIWALIVGSMPWSYEALQMSMDGFRVKYDEYYVYCPSLQQCRYAS